MCTIAETPRLPEHCIAYAYIMEWDRVFPDKKLDKDDPEHMKWIYEVALERANRFGIEGVTLFKTLGVVKNIIPAVASTNAIISACCVNEVWKLLTFGSQSMNNYYMYMGSEDIYTTTFEYGKLATCLVCSEANQVRDLTIAKDWLLSDFMQHLSDSSLFQLKKPSLTSDRSTLYMQKPPQLEQITRPNLNKLFSELIASGEVITVTDPMLTDVVLSFRIHFSD